MLKSHHVQCRQFGCHWSGLLSTRSSADFAHCLEASDSIVVFQCPRCRQEWYARVVGERVIPLPLDESEDTLEWRAWPPLEIGVGD